MPATPPSSAGPTSTRPARCRRREEVEAFLEDRDPAKRAKLVDRLLESPEFVDYWAYKWSDLFLVSSSKLPAPAMWSFYRFVRQSVAENEPWDQFARSIVTAQGSTLANGAANFFVLHRDPIDLTESTSMAFLGLSLTCARCHNHPLEKWTQDQYYGMANLFSRVQLKDGDAAGEVIVTAAPRARSSTRAGAWRCRPQPLDGAAAADRTRAATAARPSPTGWPGPTIPTSPGRSSTGSGATSSAAGLIDPEDDLRMTNPPSDEALLDWLVADFVAHRYDVKHLIRTIMNSAAYARSSVPVPGNEVGHEVPQPLPGQAAAGRGPARRDLPGHRGPDSVHRLPGRLAEPPAARQQGREHVPRRPSAGPRG